MGRNGVADATSTYNIGEGFLPGFSGRYTLIGIKKDSAVSALVNNRDISQWQTAVFGIL